MIEDLYLILHKVRGEPAFDVAIQIEVDGEDDTWIIPTSGHRAYPAQAWLLSTLVQQIPTDIGPMHIALTNCIADPKWADWPDHYTVKAGKDDRKKSIINVDADSLLKTLGLATEPKSNFKRRF